MKIAVYTIAKNEEQFVQRWAESCKDADYRIILDTGSTDNTVSFAENAGVSVVAHKFDVWRFDHARNMSLSFVPEDADICIALDMDEVLVDGWRQQLELIAPTTTRPRYKYVWSWKDDGSEGLVYGGDKIHSRHGYVWKHPVHEVIKADGITEVQEWVSGLEIHHYPDHSKSRGQYFDLLKLAVEEDPGDDRNQFYLGREYYFHQQYDSAVNHFIKHLELSKWAPERAASCRYLSECDVDNAELWVYRAFIEDSSRRENYLALAKLFYDKQDWFMCYQVAVDGLQIVNKPLDYLCSPEAWGYALYDYAAIAAYHLGYYLDAVDLGRKAVELEPNDSRLVDNLDWYSRGLASIS